ncbi:malonate decarboxylase subunit epsilon, partial [Clavibacter michiganensis subsp. insidiosus]
MSTTAVLFPGQGEQRPGMLHELPPEGDAVLAAAADALGEDPLLLDAPDVLHGT